MKTKLKIALLVVVLASSIFFKIRANKENDMVFANVEALANWEGSSDPGCLYSGSVDCPTNNVKVYKVR